MNEPRATLIVDLVNSSTTSVRLINTIRSGNFPFLTVGEYMDAGDLAITTAMKTVRNFGRKTALELDILVQRYFDNPNEFGVFNSENNFEGGKEQQITLIEKQRSNILEAYKGFTLGSQILHETISVRLRNGLMHSEYNKLMMSELLKNNCSEIHVFGNFQNVGKTSVSELFELLLDKLAVQALELGVQSPNLETLIANFTRLDVDHVRRHIGVNGQNVEARKTDPPPAPPDHLGYLNWLLKNLKPREQEVILRRFGIGRPKETLEEIGDSWAKRVTRERVRQIQAKAERRLRIAMSKHGVLHYLKAAEDDIWNKLSNSEKYITTNEVSIASNRIDGIFNLFLDLQEISISDYLDIISTKYQHGWFRNHTDPDNSIDKLFSTASSIQNFIENRVLPLPVAEVEAHPDAVPALILICDLTIFEGYVLEKKPGTRMKRALRTHSILLAEKKVIHISDLLNKYVDRHSNDQCSCRDIEIVMAALPHLFMEVEADLWLAVDGKCDALNSDYYEINLLGQQPVKSKGEDSIAECLFDYLKLNGPKSISELYKISEEILPAGRSQNSIGPILLNRVDLFVRLFPGTYGLYEHLDIEPFIATDKLSFLLNEKQATYYAKARYSNEPYSVYPYWHAQTEYQLCKWAKNNAQNIIYTSLLSIANPSVWPVNTEQKVYWGEQVEQHARYQLNEFVNQKTVSLGFSLADIAAALISAKLIGLSWLTANRVLRTRFRSHKGIGLVAFLHSIGALIEASSDIPYAEKRYTISNYGESLISSITNELHSSAYLTWSGPSGDKIVRRFHLLDSNITWFDKSILANLFDERDNDKQEPSSNEEDEFEELLEQHRKIMLRQQIQTGLNMLDED